MTERDNPRMHPLDTRDRVTPDERRLIDEAIAAGRFIRFPMGACSQVDDEHRVNLGVNRGGAHAQRRRLERVRKLNALMESRA